MTKRKKSVIIAAICALMMTGYFTMTKIGALRLAIITSGYPLSAFTFELMDESYTFYTAENQTANSLENPPVHKPTRSELVNWVVTKHGIFYTAHYYGWG